MNKLLFSTSVFIVLTSTSFAFEKYQEAIIEKKVSVEQLSAGLPSNTEAQNAVRDYFLELENLKSEIADSKRKWRKWVPKQNKTELCQSLFISANEWKTLLSKCEVNGFFVCPQSLKNYKNWLSDFYKEMEEEPSKYLQEAKECSVF